MNLLNSPTYVSNNGGILNLNGTNQKLQTVNNSPIVGSNKRTVVLWMQPNSFNGNGITSIISTGATSYNSGMFGLYATSANKFALWGHNSDYISGLNVLLENWNFVAATYDGTGTVKLHVNGLTESVGRALNTVANQMDLFLTTTGSFGEMMIYDRDLSASDLEYLYNRTKVKYPAPDGLTSATAATSAKAIKAAYPASTDGLYYINLPTVGIQQVYCLMDSKYDGGGWMMAMKATKGTTFNYDANYWYTANTLNPAQTNRYDGDAKFDVFNYYAGKDLLALWPDIPNVSTESGSIDNLTNWSWLQNSFNGGTASTLISFFPANPSAQTPIYTSTNGTMTFSGNGTPFSNQLGFTYYGFNYFTLSSVKVRWGFAWNNETNQTSNDVSGGIGMASGSYSAGDRVTCCPNNTGINTTARVEMYVR
jgi:hypothetical protein